VAYAAVCIPHCYSPKIDETVAFRWSIKTASHCVSLWLNMKPIANKLHIAWKCHSRLVEEAILQVCLKIVCIGPGYLISIVLIW